MTQQLNKNTVVDANDITQISIIDGFDIRISDAQGETFYTGKSSLFSEIKIVSKKRNFISDIHPNKEYVLAVPEYYTVSMKFEGIKISLKGKTGGYEIVISISKAAKMVIYQPGKAPESHEL